MGKFTDENIQIFIDESLEHLSDIESELLSIEQGGADIDENLVNKVYRAAHSIKGGAGFMGLANIKNLTHEMENVLAQIRSREVIPHTALINVLLSASDTLRNLINDIDSSDDADIGKHVQALQSILQKTPEPSQPDSAPAAVEKEPPPSETPAAVSEAKWDFSAAKEKILHAREKGKHVYLIAIDLNLLSKSKNATPPSLIEDMKRCGQILDSHPALSDMEHLETDAAADSPLRVLFATALQGADVGQLLDTEIAVIHTVNQNLAVTPVSDQPVDTAPARKDAVYASETIAASPERSKPDAFSTRDAPDEETEGPTAASVSAPTVSRAAMVASQTDRPAQSTELQTTVNLNLSMVDSKMSLNGEIELSRNQLLHAILSANPAVLEQIAPDMERITPEIQKVEAVAETPYPSRRDEATQETALAVQPEFTPEPVKFQSSLRVNIGLLDSLMTLAGELVLSRNQLLQAILRNDRRKLENSGQRIDLITSELQEAIMHTRMQPIRNIFDKYPRVVRDLALFLKKKIKLVVRGKDVELDKSIIESLNDPMIHLIRNAADHGIESPATRARNQKDPTGVIILKAFHEAGQVNIEIKDDGRGMDGERIAQSAIKKGLVSQEQVKGMTSKEKINLIFLPGFSMSEQITDLSGRGVGMDVVKTNLDRLGGLIEIDSLPGKGTTLHLKLPLTLAIIPSLLVSDGEERYAIPQMNVVELLRIPPSGIKNRIERIGSAQVIRLRDELLPLVELSAVLRGELSHIQSVNLEPGPYHFKKNKRGVNIVVVSTGVFKYGVIVHELHDSEEIVVKPLGRHLKDCQGYAGATILGDGRVALILDVADLARLAELASISASIREAEAPEKAPRAQQDARTLLLFRNSPQTRFAVPLELVERIEKIKCREIEIAGGRRVIKHRNQNMPLFDIGEVAQVDKFEGNKNALVIVFFIAGMDIGLLAIPPIDSIKTDCVIDETTLAQPGIAGSAVIDGQTTLMVDVISIIETVHPEWFTIEKRLQRGSGQSQTIVLAEDSKFFRNQIKCAIEDAGFNVLEAEDGMAAWKLLDQHAEETSLVVTDLEMPNLDGFGFTRKIRADERFTDLPVIAVSSLAGKDDIKKAKASGVTEYQIKLDRKKLVDCINQFMEKAKQEEDDADA